MPGFIVRHARAALAALFVVALAGAPDALADEGIPVEVRVLDAAGKALPTAVVRHPDEQERHHVNTVTGSWVGSVLYMPDGSMVPFEKGAELTFEVSAPGHITQTVRYVVRKRKNVIEVVMQEMPQVEEEEEDMPIIGFGRDKPIGGMPVD